VQVGRVEVERTEMAKSITAASADERSLSGRVMAWPERVKTFYNDVRTEMRKVTTPSFKDVRATTAVVIITVFLFGLYFWAVDNTIGSGINYLFKYLIHR
jgi:preprotein translocase subunit SecE